MSLGRRVSRFVFESLISRSFEFSNSLLNESDVECKILMVGLEGIRSKRSYVTSWNVHPSCTRLKIKFFVMTQPKEQPGLAVADMLESDVATWFLQVYIRNNIRGRPRNSYVE